MIKVLHIFWSAHFGGIQKAILDLASAQTKNSELKVGILCGNKNGEFMDRFQNAGFPCYLSDLETGYDISPRKCLRIINIFKKYDVLHFHIFNPVISTCAILSRKRIVFTVHGNLGSSQKKSLSSYVKTILQGIFLNSCADYISFNSEFTKKNAERKYSLIRVRKSVIYNGVALVNSHLIQNEIEKSFLSRIQGKFVVGTTSRFVEFKRIDRLIKAFSIFQKNRETVLLLVGDGILRKELNNLIVSLALSEKTIFTGFRHNVREFQRLMDVCVFPFENEAFGLVSLETLSLGKPTIVFKDGGGITEVIGNLSKDDIVEDIFGLARRLDYYYLNRKAISSFSKERISYAKKYDINVMVEKFYSVYHEILPRR